MTNEEKAKTYNEALERAKECITDKKFCETEDTIRSVIEYIFPELAESDNERIRKEFIKFIKWSVDRHFMREDFHQAKRPSEWISYLEKQKANTEGDFGRGYDCGYQAGYAIAMNEMKSKVATATLDSEKQKEPLPVPDKFSGLKSLMLQYLQSAANRKDDTEIESDTDLFGRKILDYVWKYSDEQKEQNKITIKQVYKEFINPEKLKDAKTNKYIRAQLFWELAHNGIITAVDYQYLIDDNRKPWTEEEYLKAYRKGFDVSEQLKQKEQKPLTTEETELNSIAFLEQVGYTCIPPRKEQKPAQTAEEKEYVRTLKGLISDFIRDCGGCTIDTEYYQKICNWLDGRHIEQKQVEKQDYSGLNDFERAIHRGFLSAGVENVPVTIIKETAKECLAQIKPAEWDEYTKTNLDRAIQIIKKAKGKLQGYQTDDGIYECDKAIEALEHFLYRGLEIEKPAEWSEEDDWKRKELIQYLEEKGDYRTVWMTWLKSLPERFNLQPKEEWSEEDEEIFNNIIEKAKGGHWIEVNEITWLITRFKSLRPQGSKDSLQTHWKPSEEWNEEDKQYFDDLIARIEKSRRTNRCYVYTDDVDWLKSKLNGNSGK